jgi:hypothetical protein
VARSVVQLPPGVRAPFTVYVNGVEQREGEDFSVRGDELVFSRELIRAERLGLRHWALGAIGIGTYRKDDSVDVRYELADGRPMVAQRLAVSADHPGES